MLGNNSCGVHSLLGAKYGIGLRTSDNTDELEILTYDGARMRVGETRRRGAGARSSGPAGAGARSTPRSGRCATGTPTRSARRHAEAPRRVSGYNLDELLARERLQRRAGPGRDREHLRHHPRSHAAPGAQPEGPVAAGARLPGHLRRRRSPRRDPASSSRPPWRAWTTCCSTRSRPRATRTANIEPCRRTAGLLDGRVRRRVEGGLRRPGPAVHGEAQGGRTRRP